MSKKQTEPRPQGSALTEPETRTAPDLSSISPAQLAANRANAQLSSGPRTQAGLAKSSGLAGASTPESSKEFAGRARAVAGPSKGAAVKSALTGRTVLLPTDDRDEYARFLADFQQQLKPVGPLESELVQIIVDCHWRLGRIQELEFALYAHGHEQFESVFQDCPESERGSRILLQTHLTYEKQLRNLHIQEARIDRKRAKAVAELDRLQAEREPAEEASIHDLPDSEAFALLDAGYVPPHLAQAFAATAPTPQNGFVFSNDENARGTSNTAS